MGKQAAPSFPPLSGCRFAVGHDRNGRWVICDTQGIVGGIFKDRASAVKFALEESDHQPGQVFCVPDNQVLSVNAIFAPPKPNVVMLSHAA